MLLTSLPFLKEDGPRSLNLWSAADQKNFSLDLKIFLFPFFFFLTFYISPSFD